VGPSCSAWPSFWPLPLPSCMGGLPQLLSWLLLADGAIFVVFPVIAPFSPRYGGVAGVLLGVAAPLLTLVGVVWLGVVLWSG
jgi:hypothetical protein